MKSEYMKILYYFFRYSLIMLIGYLLKYVVIYSIFNLPYIIIIAYNYLAILYGIKKPLEIRRDIRFNKLLCPLMLMTTLLNKIQNAIMNSLANIYQKAEEIEKVDKEKADWILKRVEEIRKDIKYNKILCPLIFMTTLLNTIFMALLSISFSRWFIISIINIIELIFMKPNYEKNEEKTQKYIEEYFRNKNK